MATSEYTYNWADLAFSSKKEVRNLNATFVAAPRVMSAVRFTKLIKSHLPSGHIIVGIANEEYIDGFENQPQFRTLRIEMIQGLIDTVNAKSHHKIYVLTYSQRDISALYEKLGFRQVILINGSWKYSFHTRPEYYTLVQKCIPYVMESPFVDENEAKEYEEKVAAEISYFPPNGSLSEVMMMNEAEEVAKRSYDTSFQVGLIAARKEKNGYYKIALTAHNTVVPYETFALHRGASRERHFTAPGDQNYYDAAHDVISLLVKATKEKVSLKGLTLFSNLLPCPSCARAVCLTDVDEIVYSRDHSDGYAVALLEAAGKKVRRIVNINEVI